MDLDAPRRAPSGRRWVTGSYVLAWLSVIFYPVILGPLAIAMAVIGSRRGDPDRGRRAAAIAASCMVAGFALYAIVLPLAMRNAPQGSSLPVLA